MVDHAKLPNLVNVAVVGFIYFWRKMKAFRPLEGRRCDEIQFERIQLVNYYSRKPSFTLKIVQNLFLRTQNEWEHMVLIQSDFISVCTCYNLPTKKNNS